ncbi:sigma-70 family RNA polymerase sigma factor [Oleomonas cavernae]|nr:sigma-70 family RNA polymerase sigma factor [Oleomonas cavernae]
MSAPKSSAGGANPLPVDAAAAAKFDIRVEVIAVMPHLRAFARFLTGHRERADDLVQDAVVRALTAAHQFQPGTNFKAWMFTILRNLFYNEGRKTKVKLDPLDDVTANQHAMGPTQEAGLEFDDFRRAFWRLTEEQREVLILVGASGVSYEEAAEICNCAVGTIKSRVSRARAQLTRILSGSELGSRLSEDGPMPAEMAAFLALGGSTSRPRK